MRSRLPVSVAALLILMVAGGASVATGGEPGRLAAFAARQDLYDEVCIALADGSINRVERWELLSFGKKILKPVEYQKFRETIGRLPKSSYYLPPPRHYNSRAFDGGKDFWNATVAFLALDQLSPPKKSVAKRAAKIARKKPAPSKRSKAQVQAKPLTKPSIGPVFPACAILPDRMVPPVFVR